MLDPNLTGNALPNGIMMTLQQLKQLIEASSDAELKTQAATLIATVETEFSGLTLSTGQKLANSSKERVA